MLRGVRDGGDVGIRSGRALCDEWEVVRWYGLVTKSRMEISQVKSNTSPMLAHHLCISSVDIDNPRASITRTRLERNKNFIYDMIMEPRN